MAINTFKRELGRGNPQIGLWISLASIVSTEALASSGFDWILIDTEHTPTDLPTLYAQLQAAAAGTAHAVVRPPWNDAVIIKRYLDAGVQSFLIPYVQNEDEARQAVAATRYPPDGVRGFAAATRASRFGRVADYHARSADEICVLVQAETREALGNLEAIARVPGVDGVFVGPGDLSADMGLLGQPGHPDVAAAIDDAIGRIRRCGKAAGVLTADETLIRRYIDKGSVFTAVGSDLGLLLRPSERLAATFKTYAAGVKA